MPSPRQDIARRPFFPSITGWLSAVVVVTLQNQRLIVGRRQTARSVDRPAASGSSISNRHQRLTHQRRNLCSQRCMCGVTDTIVRSLPGSFSSWRISRTGATMLWMASDRWLESSVDQGSASGSWYTWYCGGVFTISSSAVVRSPLPSSLCIRWTCITKIVPFDGHSFVVRKPNCDATGCPTEQKRRRPSSGTTQAAIPRPRCPHPFLARPGPPCREESQR